MRSDTPGARNTAKSILRKAGLLPAAQRISTILTAPAAYRAHERRFRQLKRQHGHVLGERLNDPQSGQRFALVCSPTFPEVEIELGLIKGLQLANFVPVVLITDTGREARLLAQYYKLAAVGEIHQWSDFVRRDRQHRRRGCRQPVKVCPGPPRIRARRRSCWKVRGFNRPSNHIPGLSGFAAATA